MKPTLFAVVLFSALLFVCKPAVKAQDTNPHLNTALMGHVAYPQGLSNLWYYVDATSGREYAIVGTRTGTSIVDVTVPNMPQEKAFVPGPQSIWREVRVFEHYAYVVTEAGGGVTIIDMAGLPSSVETYTWTGAPTVNISSAHTVFVDIPAERLYIFGANVGAGGAIIADLSVSPTNPPVIGQFTPRYIHDALVRNDTLWAGEINDGLLEVIDVSNPAAPQVMASFATPNNFTHNCALSDDGRYVFTTDEVANAYIAAYDVSDLSDIKELDRIQSYREGQNDLSSPHNVYTVPDNFIVCSYYTDGVQIYDATHPDNLILVGYYDCSPLEGTDMEGDWGVAPGLPSGNLLLSDMQEGLFIVKPNYIHAAYFLGNVTDADSGAGIPNATITVIDGNATTHTDFNGGFQTGTIGAGYFSVIVSAPGYATDTIENVLLINGVDVYQSFSLQSLPTFTVQGRVLTTQYGPIPAATVQLKAEDGTVRTATTDANGNYTIAAIYATNYEIIAGKWGYQTKLVNESQYIAEQATIDIVLWDGYYDPFALDFGWTSTGETNTGGHWDLGVPIETGISTFVFNPGADSPNDFDNQCYSTGNSGDLYDFVNGGQVRLTSPVMLVANFQQAELKFDAWFRNINQNFTPTNDSLIVIANNGTQQVTIDKIRLTLGDPWTTKTYQLADHLPLTDNMTITFVAKADNNNNELLECGVDNFSLKDLSIADGIANTASTNVASIEPNPFSEQTQIQLATPLQGEAVLYVYDLQGKEVHRQKVTQTTILLQRQQLASGMYLFSVQQQQHTIATGKLIVY
ncbi:MAG: choice-of-anchor B family protein [Chitinophagales bacterium]|nr:choice-of-anchor B family protein [Chitinophagales bacterium]